MLIPKKNRHLIYETVFKEGVMVAKNDVVAPKHPELPTVPNLHVIKIMQSLKSRDYVKEQFAWRHFYWYLTNEGISYLRNYLNLPAEIVPATLKRPSRGETARPRPSTMRADHSRSDEDRSSYRRPPPQMSDKKADVGAGSSDVVFKVGYGRGRGAPPPQ